MHKLHTLTHIGSLPPKKLRVPQKHYICSDFSYLSTAFFTNFLGSVNIATLIVAIVVHIAMDFVDHPPEEIV